MPQIVLDYWKAVDSSKGAKKDRYSTQGLNLVLGHGAYKKLPFDKAFSYFSDTNRRAKTFYEEGTANNYPEKKLAGSATLAKGASKKFTAKLDHLSSNSYRFTPGAGSKDLRVSISGAPKAAGTRAVVTVIKAGGKAKQKFVKISAKGKGAVKVGFKAGDIVAVEVTLVNASTRYLNCFPDRNYSQYACGGKPADQNKAISVSGRAV